jgi:glycine dehydrogenase subunit 1
MPRYIPSTEDQQREMLRDIGVSSIEQLFSDIPDSIRLKRRLDLPEAMSEMELMPLLRGLAARNADTENYTCFLGAGSYDHHIPSIIGHLISRQEFCTSYTPYQPEISQGTLQAIFEYQSMICLLTGMDVSNASLYDGATALAEAASMACRATGRTEILVAKSIHPESMDVLKTYSRFTGRQVSEYGCKNGAVDLEDLEGRISDNTAAVIVQNPNFFGIVENLSELAELVHKSKALLIVSCDPISLAILKSPGEAGADIAVGEGQSLGNPLSFGGPYLGFIAARNELMRRMPGRIVGETVDKNGKRAFVLTIQTREQHIRREKATSNICSNQSLNALAATIYLTTLGKSGLVKVATLCAQKAYYAFQKLLETGCFSPMFNAPFFREFVLQYDGDTDELNSRLLGHRIIGGLSLEKMFPELRKGWLLAVTEKRTKEEIDNLAEKVVSL